MNGRVAVGIEALNVYCGLAQIPVQALFEGRGLDLSRMANILQDKRSIGLGFEDPVTNAVNAAKPIVDALGGDKDRIEVLVTSSESGVDYSKSIASYVHEYLELGRNCRVFEVKQACYAATAAVQMALGYVASGIAPGAKALVIGTDVALVDGRAEYAEPATGFGGAAVLVSDEPGVLMADFGAFGSYSYQTPDSARPLPSMDIADVDQSLFAYLDCLANSFDDYRSRVAGVGFATSFDFLAMHTPFAGLVLAAHRKMMREAGIVDSEVIQADSRRRVLPSLTYPRAVGNLCSASLYLALASLIECRDGEDPARVGLFSYGSGCSSEFFSGLIDGRSRSALAPMRIAEHLDMRTELSFAGYEELLAENLRAIVPVEEREIDVERFMHYVPPGRTRTLLALRRVKGYYRQYEWI